MDKLRKNVCTEGKWRIQICCCCCNLRTGTTVLGVCSIIYTFAAICFPQLDPVMQTASENENIFKDPKWIIMTIIRVLCIGTLAAMVYGNIKNVTRLMIPYLYITFVVIILSIVLTFVTAMWFIFTARFGTGFVALLFNCFLSNAISLYYWHVIRCRTLDIDDIDQPIGTNGVIYSQQDPEVPPPYGNAQVNYGITQNTYEKPEGEPPTYGSGGSN